MLNSYVVGNLIFQLISGVLASFLYIRPEKSTNIEPFSFKFKYLSFWGNPG